VGFAFRALDLKGFDTEYIITGAFINRKHPAAARIIL
jgi:hypothetical protein